MAKLEEQWLAQTVLDAVSQGKSVMFPNGFADSSDIRMAYELAGKSQWNLSSFDAGHTDYAPGMKTVLEYYDALLFRGWLRPERSGLESQHGSRADARVHTDTATLDCELIDRDLAQAVSQGIVDDLLVLNFGSEARGSVYIEPAPIENNSVEIYKTLVNTLLMGKATGTAVAKKIDIDGILDSLNVPVEDDQRGALAGEIEKENAANGQGNGQGEQEQGGNPSSAIQLRRDRDGRLIPLAFDPDQARDEKGQWTKGAGVGRKVEEDVEPREAAAGEGSSPATSSSGAPNNSSGKNGSTRELLQDVDPNSPAPDPAVISGAGKLAALMNNLGHRIKMLTDGGINQIFDSRFGPPIKNPVVTLQKELAGAWALYQQRYGGVSIDAAIAAYRLEKFPPAYWVSRASWNEAAGTGLYRLRTATVVLPDGRVRMEFHQVMLVGQGDKQQEVGAGIITTEFDPLEVSPDEVRQKVLATIDQMNEKYAEDQRDSAIIGFTLGVVLALAALPVAAGVGALDAAAAAPGSSLLVQGSSIAANSALTSAGALATGQAFGDAAQHFAEGDNQAAAADLGLGIAGSIGLADGVIGANSSAVKTANVKQFKSILGDDAEVISGAEANNRSIQDHPSWEKTPPHDPSMPAAQGRVASGQQLVRVWGKSGTMEGSFLMRRVDVVGLTPEQIADKFALIEVPTNIAEADATNLEVRVSVVRKNFSHKGGGIQVELPPIARDNVKFSNARELPTGGIQ